MLKPTPRTLAVTAAVIAVALAFVALRDAAGRLDTPDEPGRGDTSSGPLVAGSAGVGTAFTPGPLLGDLKPLMTLGPAAVEEFPEPERFSLEGVTVEGDEPDPDDSQPRRPRRPQRPRDPDLCNLPAFC